TTSRSDHIRIVRSLVTLAFQRGSPRQLPSASENRPHPQLRLSSSVISFVASVDLSTRPAIQYRSNDPKLAQILNGQFQGLSCRRKRAGNQQNRIASPSQQLGVSD